MTVKELIKELGKFDDDDMVVINDDEGWSNIEKIQKDKTCLVRIVIERYPVFSDN